MNVDKQVGENGNPQVENSPIIRSIVSAKDLTVFTRESCSFPANEYLPEQSERMQRKWINYLWWDRFFTFLEKFWLRISVIIILLILNYIKQDLAELLIPQIFK